MLSGSDLSLNSGKSTESEVEPQAGICCWAKSSVIMNTRMRRARALALDPVRRFHAERGRCRGHDRRLTLLPGSVIPGPRS
jgi:hypothetical protein